MDITEMCSDFGVDVKEGTGRTTLNGEEFDSKELFENMMNFSTSNQREYITVDEFEGDEYNHCIYYSAADQEWTDKAKKELWDNYNVIMNDGVVGAKIDGKLITLGIEDDGTVSFSDNSLCFNVFWVDWLIDLLKEAKKRINESEKENYTI